MLYTYTDTVQAVAVNAPVLFNVNGVQTGCTATHAPGTASVNINKPGIYMVHFNADVAAAAGAVDIQLFNNGVAVPGAEGSYYSGAVTEFGNIAFEALIRVCPDCCRNSCEALATLTFVNTGVAATIENAAVVVTKLA